MCLSFSFTFITKRGFFPVVVGFIRRIPVLGSILNLPFISAVSINLYCTKRAALLGFYVAWLNFMFMNHLVLTLHQMKGFHKFPRFTLNYAERASAFFFAGKLNTMLFLHCCKWIMTRY